LNLESQKINSKNLAYAKNKEKLDIQHTVLYWAKAKCSKSVLTNYSIKRNQLPWSLF